MSEYWTTIIGDVLAEEGIEITSEQATRLGKSIAGCASVEVEATGVAEQTRAGKPQPSEEQKRIDRLEEIIQRLGKHFGVGVDINAGEILYETPVGTSHWGTASKRLPY